MFCLFLFIMCLHPRLELDREESELSVSDLGQFDTCDYVYSLKGASVDDLVVIQLNIRGLSSKISALTNFLNSCVDGRLLDIVLLSET